MIDYTINYATSRVAIQGEPAKSVKVSYIDKKLIAQIANEAATPEEFLKKVAAIGPANEPG